MHGISDQTGGEVSPASEDRTVQVLVDAAIAQDRADRLQRAEAKSADRKQFRNRGFDFLLSLLGGSVTAILTGFVTPLLGGLATRLNRPASLPIITET